MQIFLPYPSLKDSVSCLDPSCLGNQCYRECLTMIRGGWPHHRVSKMWKDYKHAMAQYALFGFEELTRRGRHYPHHIKTFTEYLNMFPDTGLPSFIGDEKFHASHRAALLFKKPAYYSQFNWAEKPELNYIWPNQSK